MVNYDDDIVYKSWNEMKQTSVATTFSKRIDRKEVTSTQELKNMEVAARVIQKMWKTRKRGDQSLMGVLKSAEMASRGGKRVKNDK